ncbi:hypothetical protein E4U40_003616 [Claviceps sp. LM458 group G5]|nr:hypothetical protein E4U40_003616 [Claviceps sp. LM458 group G5]
MPNPSSTSVTTSRQSSPIANRWRERTAGENEPLERNSSIVDHLKYLATFPKAQQLDSDLALDELSHVDAVLVTRIAEKGIDIEHALTNGSSPLPEEGQLGFVSNSTLPVMGSRQIAGVQPSWSMNECSKHHL